MKCSSPVMNYRTKSEKSRNLSEKKRRDQFNMLINELCSMVSTSNRKMDKSSVLRSTIAFLRSHSEVSVQSQSLEIQENWKPSFLSNEEFTHLTLEALDGFILVFSSCGRILYASESITTLLGYLPGSLSSSIFDLVHESDKPPLYKLLNSAPSATDQNDNTKHSCVALSLHMKHGPIHSSDTPTFERIRLIGTFHTWRPSYTEDPDDTRSSSINSRLNSNSMEWKSCFVAMARLQTPQLLREMTLCDNFKNEFTSRHSMEWKFLFLDHRAPPIIGYLPFEVLGTCGYDYYHVDDLDQIAACHEALMQTGEGTSCYYRFLTKGQQWIWLQTRYFITYHQWNSKPEFIVCTHSVISYDHVQATVEMEIKKNKQQSPKIDSSPCPPGSTSSQALRERACQSPTPSVTSRCSLSSTVTDFSRAIGSSTLQEGLVYSRSSEPSRSQQPVAGSLAVHPAKSISSSVEHLPSTIQLSSSVPVQNTSSVVTIATLQPLVGISRSPLLTSSNINTFQQPVSQGECVQSAIVMTPGHTQLQDYLKRRHQLLQQQILLQQEELRRVSEQLMLVQFVPPNFAVTTMPLQEGNPQSSVYVSPSTIATVVESGISKTVTVPSLNKSAISTAGSIMFNPQVLSQAQGFLPLPLSQDQSQIIFNTVSKSTQ
ncbi:circadian locomoter output cycles protein kaput-like isoform X1 [Limulus polyphemus]|uniref:Circadian locomoter output cycles protein kaput-like isoform X1 n=1 Tax=Limulus polyphemus TaxID=6850 RepID=A0ABM1B4W5_LIMPO|nr:circadian locomoter output cycles protein kaput-like isoform X1 [Limulus polyphemus]XP_022242032.1 circadian locomoter output cycles protein kaput-like isoform X1 [Limulus polyphemus]XP_022242033.1 circadian locomoter output cycles protein kaput-like isoform X1 [Limulus polyphemus]